MQCWKCETFFFFLGIQCFTSLFFSAVSTCGKCAFLMRQRQVLNTSLTMSTQLVLMFLIISDMDVVLMAVWTAEDRCYLAVKTLWGLLCHILNFIVHQTFSEGYKWEMQAGQFSPQASVLRSHAVLLHLNVFRSFSLEYMCMETTSWQSFTALQLLHVGMSVT